MYRAYGRGGYGRGFGMAGMPVQTPTGYAYLGPCRCGRGPDAYYRTPDGRIVHASQMFQESVQTPEQLRAEKEMLERRLKEIEEKIEKK